MTPQIYATGAATVIAWMLVFMLLITPRTFFVGGAGGISGLLGRRGMISGARGGASVIGVGTRPWLQKVAALTVAVSMTIATADTFRVAEQQYLTGYMDADKLRSEVVNSNELKISRIVSDIFIWLALVQTLIRLFPRHKEKVLIKWIGFALIILDSTFMILNSFMGNPVGRPKVLNDVIPMLSYLFQLALGVLYAAWVIYYSICKRKYAFYSSYMWNLSLIAALSLTAIVTPIIFFALDISQPDVAGWGDYFRWVGAAAASVIVWEWVERIEAVEREEKKDGILGREVFDGDEMLEVIPHDNTNMPRRRRRFFGGSGRSSKGDDGGETALSSSTKSVDPPESDLLAIARRNLRERQQRRQHAGQGNDSNTAGLNTVATPPPAALSPVSRADTASAASTVYTIRYHTMNTPTTPLARTTLEPILTNDAAPTEIIETEKHGESQPSATGSDTDDSPVKSPTTLECVVDPTSRRWQNLFKRRKALPPEEVRNGQIIRPILSSSTDALNQETRPAHNYGKWDVKGRVGAFAAEQGERWIERRNRTTQEVDLPVTIIPAQSRGGRTWSPQVEAERAQQAATAPVLQTFEEEQEDADAVHVHHQYEVEDDSDEDDEDDEDSLEESVHPSAKPEPSPSRPV